MPATVELVWSAESGGLTGRIPGSRGVSKQGSGCLAGAGLASVISSKGPISRQELLRSPASREATLSWSSWLEKKKRRTIRSRGELREVETVQVALKSNRSLPATAAVCESAGRQSDVTAETVRKLCRRGQLNEAVEALGLLVYTHCCVSKSLFCTLLKQCVLSKHCLGLGRHVHALIVKTGCGSDTFLCNQVLRMYASHGCLEEAMDVFTIIPKPDAFTWSAIMSAYVQHGQAGQAIQLYHRMRTSNVEPDGHVFVAALQACARTGDVRTGQQVHADVLAARLEPEPELFVFNSLVDMYSKCGRLEDAQALFVGLPRKDVVTWNALIAGYSQQGMGQEALSLYNAMQQEGEAIAEPDSVTFVCLLQACACVGIPALKKAKQLHAQIEARGLQGNLFVANSLVNMYAKCGSLRDAQLVFDGLDKKTVVTWTALMAGYSQQGMGKESLRLYSAMQQEGLATPNSVTFVCLLEACASVGAPALDDGKELHAQIGELGLQADVLVANSLVNMYAKCGSLEDAQSVFDSFLKKDVVTWTVLIAGYSQQGMDREALCHLYTVIYQQLEGDVAPNSATFVGLLQACASVGVPAFESGRQLHAQIAERGLQADEFVANSLVNMYAKCGSLWDAQHVFDLLHHKDVVTWNSIIAAYSQRGMCQEALHLYRDMQKEDILAPDSVTFACLLKACASVGNQGLEYGRHLHAEIVKRGLQADSFTANCLVNMYVNCGSLVDAQVVFDGLVQKNVVTWNAIMAGYSQQGMGQAALHLYGHMQEEGISAPDSVTFVCLLQACAGVGTLALEKGKQIHGQIRESVLEADVAVANALVNMYAKCGSLKDAHGMFDGLGEKNVVTWTSLIAAYSQQGMGQEALSLYKNMQEECIVAPDSATFVCLLQACAKVAALNLGRQLHAQIVKLGLEADGFVAVSLMNMYAKVGSTADALQVFEELPKRDVVAWNALIAGYTCQGNSEVVFDLLQRMKEDGVQPTAVTFLSVLKVCSHAGLVTKGQEYFEVMSKHHGILPTVEHYTCIVDLLGRAGKLDEALSVIKTMPVLPDAALWHTLLSACRKWSNVEVGRHAFYQAVSIDKKDASAYVAMSSIYAGAQMWEAALEIQARRIGIEAWKQPGQSWWTDMDGVVHSFLVGHKEDAEEIENHVLQGGSRRCSSLG